MMLGQEMTPLEGALHIASRGLPVAPCRYGEKTPTRKAWKQRATRNPEDIGIIFGGKPCNVAVPTEGLIVLDDDTRKKGLPEWHMIDALPPTFTVETPSGGRHYYFRRPDGVTVSNSAGALAPGYDIRTDGGHVIGPGSVFDGKPYRIIDASPIADVPLCLLSLCQSYRAPKSETRQVGELDTPSAIDSATSYLKHSAPEAIEHSGGNATTYKVACQVRDRGISPETALELMLEHYNETKCFPAWEPGELQEIVDHAYAYGQNAAGRDNPALGFEVVELPKPERASRPTLFGSSARRWVGKKPAPIPFVIDQLVPEGLVTLLVSAGGRGKSTLAQQMLSCVASGRPFLGFDVKRGASAGIFCEDADNTLHNRQLAICRTLKIELEDIADNISPESFLGSDAVLWTERNGATPLLAEIEAQLGSRPDAKLLVVDGVSYVFAAHEIDRGQVTRFIAALTAVAQRLGIAVVLIHHESKTTADTDTNAASGSTAWINACRSVVKLNDDGGDLRTLKHIKTNLAKRVPPLPCTLASGAFALIHDNAERREEVRGVARTLLGEAIDAGVKLSDKPQAREQWAPRYLAKQARGQGVAEVEYETAIRSLAGEFTFVTEFVRSKPSRRCVRTDAATLPPDPDSATAATPPPD